jgi:hypothetical protein
VKFNFVLSVDAQAGDQLDDLRDQIEALGHEFTFSRADFKPPPWFNIFGEGTSETTRQPHRVLEMGRAGYQLIALITEQPTRVTGEGLVWNYMGWGGWGGPRRSLCANHSRTDRSVVLCARCRGCHAAVRAPLG